jgi:hypothetical protein
MAEAHLVMPPDPTLLGSQTQASIREFDPAFVQRLDWVLEVPVSQGTDMLQLAPCRCHPALLSCTRGRTSWVCFIASPTQLLISLLGSQLELNFSLIICAGIEAIDLRVHQSQCANCKHL